MVNQISIPNIANQISIPRIAKQIFVPFISKQIFTTHPLFDEEKVPNAPNFSTQKQDCLCMVPLPWLSLLKIEWKWNYNTININNWNNLLLAEQERQGKFDLLKGSSIQLGQLAHQSHRIISVELSFDQFKNVKIWIYKKRKNAFANYKSEWGWKV